MSGIDRDERAQALKAIYDGLKMALDGAHAYQLACLRLNDQANDQGDAARIVTTPAQIERPLTLDELAARLGRNKRTIQQWVSDYGLPELRAHSNADPLFDWPEVLEWMKRHRKINRVEHRGNGRIAPAPSSGTRPQATQRRG